MSMTTDKGTRDRDTSAKDSEVPAGDAARDHGAPRPPREPIRHNGALAPGQLIGQEPGFRGGGTPHITDISNAVTVKDNQVFMLTDTTGDIVSPENGQGIYFRDMRYLDHMEMLLGGQRAISLLADSSQGNQSIFELANPHMLLAN